MVEAAPQGHRLERQQHGRPVEGAGESPAVACDHVPGAEQPDAGLGEQLVVGLHLAPARHRAVGDHDVEGVDREVGEETVEVVLPAHEVDATRQAEGGLEESAHEGLRDDVRHAHVEPQRLRGGAPLDRAGRIRPNPDMTLPGHPEVFVVGDMIALDNLPGVAQVAIQGAKYAAKEINNRLEGKQPQAPFPKGGDVCSLSDILETGDLPQRFFLTPKACAGILRRAAGRGKTLPPPLQRALQAVAGLAPTSISMAG